MRKTNLVKMLLSFCLVIAGSEVGVRAIASRLPQPSDWHSPEIQNKAFILATQGQDFSMIVTGTSQVRQGINPLAVDSSTNNRWFSYNTALSSAVPSFQEVWLQDQVLPNVSPDVVVWGLNPLIDLNRPDGSSPIAAYNQARATKSGMLAELDRRLSTVSKLAEYRPVLREPANLLRLTNSPPEVLATRVDNRGFETVFGQSVQQDDAEFARRALSAGYSGTEEAALTRSIAAMHARGIEVVILEMPVPDRLLQLAPEDTAGSPFDRVDYEREVDRLTAVAGEQGAVVIRLHGLFQDPGNFTDYTHLSEEAAWRFSKWVGVELDDRLN